ncbi:stathmin-4-like isoform X2 [Festucalex cinctus]
MMTFAVCGEKLPGLPLLSFLCSCIVQKASHEVSGAKKEGTSVDLKLGAIRHLEAAGDCASGRTFQVILQPPAFLHSGRKEGHALSPQSIQASAAQEKMSGGGACQQFGREKGT